MTITPDQLKSIKAGDVLEFAPGFRLTVTYQATWTDGQGITIGFGKWGLYEYRLDYNGKNNGGCRVLDIIAINPPEAPPGTVRVKIAVAVAEDGYWHGYGRAHSADGSSALHAAKGLTEPRISWVYANIPPPEVSEIEGELG